MICMNTAIIEPLTAKIQVDCMAEIAAPRNSSKKRSNRNKLEEDGIWSGRNSL